MSKRTYVNKPSANPDLGWINRSAALRQNADGAAGRDALKNKKEEQQNCEGKLGQSLENEINNVSPNATNIAR